MLNFYRPYFMPCFGSHCENGKHFENFETQNCSSNGDLSLCKILCLYHYRFRSSVTHSCLCDNLSKHGCIWIIFCMWLVIN
jgi:hypothetical protein